jgi:hypothetical protein
MKQGKTRLSENHRRSLSSALMIVEQMLIEMEELMVIRKNSCCFKITDDIEPEDRDHNLEIIGKAREQICKLAEKYGANKQNQSLSRSLNAKKTKVWEILCDIKAKKQKGFGEFPKDLIKDYDSDIEYIMTITDKIKS